MNHVADKMRSWNVVFRKEEEKLKLNEINSNKSLLSIWVPPAKSQSYLSPKPNTESQAFGMGTPCDSIRSWYVRVFFCCCWIKVHSWFPISLSFFKMNVNNSVSIDNRIIESMTVLSMRLNRNSFASVFKSFVHF